jgi:acetyl-CoA synthetase
MGWIMGSWQMIGAHCAGAAILMYDGAVDYPDPSRLWSMCERHKVSILGLTPTLVRVLAAHGAAAVDKHDLSKVRILGSTGEPWDET